MIRDIYGEVKQCKSCHVTSNRHVRHPLGAQNLRMSAAANIAGRVANLFSGGGCGHLIYRLPPKRRRAFSRLFILSLRQLNEAE